MGDPRGLCDPHEVLPVPQGPGESQGQDYCRESSFYKDLRSADILNSSKALPLFHPCAPHSCLGTVLFIPLCP